MAYFPPNHHHDDQIYEVIRNDTLHVNSFMELAVFIKVLILCVFNPNNITTCTCILL